MNTQLSQPLRHSSYIVNVAPQDSPEFQQIANSFRGEMSDEARTRKTLALMDDAVLHIKQSQAGGKIVNCIAESVIDSIKNVARCGLTLSPAAQQCYLVPFKNICTLMIGYKGFVELLYRCGVKRLVVDLVYEGDDFEITKGSDGYVKHIPNYNTNRTYDKIVCGYGIATLPSGKDVVWDMSKAEIDKVKASSSKKTDGPWQYWSTSMAKKSLIRAGEKYLPKNFGDPEALQELRTAINHDDQTAYDMHAFTEHVKQIENKTKADADDQLANVALPEPVETARNINAEKMALLKTVQSALHEKQSQWLTNNGTPVEFVQQVCQQVLHADHIDSLEQMDAVQEAMKSVDWDTADIIPGE